MEMDCKLCPFKKFDDKLKKDMCSSWQEYVGFKWNHLCTEHGALGANVAFEHTRTWIEEFIRNKPKNHRADAVLFKTLHEAGFQEYGFWEQGAWQILYRI
jgi:hypothetical protein